MTTTTGERRADTDAPRTQQLPVSGAIRTIACREGSSGIFTGTISGLYQGYRLGSAAPDEQRVSIDAPYGSLALVLTQRIVTPLPPRPAVHPFADGADPFAARAAHGPGGPGHGPGGPGGPGHGPGGPKHGPGGAEPRGTEGGKPIFKRVHYMETTVRADGEHSTGVFAGATGTLELEAPAYRMPGYLVVQTAEGDLCLEFLEKGSRDELNADLWVDGDRSTGRYARATGALTFSLRVTPPFFGEGTYEGVLHLVP